MENPIETSSGIERVKPIESQYEIITATPERPSIPFFCETSDGRPAAVSFVINNKSFGTKENLRIIITSLTLKGEGRWLFQGYISGKTEREIHGLYSLANGGTGWIRFKEKK